MRELTLHEAARITRCPPSQIRFAVRRGWINGVQVNDDVPPGYIIYWDRKTKQTLIALGVRSRERDRRRKRRRQGGQR